ncbi:MAG: hypothetical protein Q9M97_07035 [Candidatus Gracilibacteria bacterium]|nr:hypothetical protein [Candidatus Gracilibacteria bacterium]
MIFDNIDLKISGKINISDFEKKITKVFRDIPKIKAEYLLKKEKEKGKLTQITYSIITGKYYIK